MAAAAPSTSAAHQFAARAADISAEASSAPTWEELRSDSHASAVGTQLLSEQEQRVAGAGPAHTDAALRLFGTTGKPRVTLFRDQAAWCPYCQKVWLLFEEKKIPFQIEKVPMRSYGDKPREFLERVPSGLLPVIELDGQVITESLVIMQVLDEAFPDTPMLPPSGSEGRQQAQELLRLERELFGRWCELTFRPSMPFLGGGARREFEECLDRVNSALESTPGPFFLGGDRPDLIDLQYVSHVERMTASVLYWKGLQMRGTDRWAALERWLQAFEQRPEYLATKSDYYTHVQDIPPQYGPGFGENEAKTFAGQIDGSDGVSWKLPLPPLTEETTEPWQPLPLHLLEGIDGVDATGGRGARHEAAFKVIGNHGPVTRFALRGAGKPGRKRFQAPLADPYAEPNEAFETAVDCALRHVVAALAKPDSAPVEPRGPEFSAMRRDLAEVAKGDSDAVRACLAYLRDRVGVPRDMSYPAARQFRAHLNWAIDALP